MSRNGVVLYGLTNYSAGKRPADAVVARFVLLYGFYNFVPCFDVCRLGRAMVGCTILSMMLVLCHFKQVRYGEKGEPAPMHRIWCLMLAVAGALTNALFSDETFMVRTMRLYRRIWCVRFCFTSIALLLS